MVIWDIRKLVTPATMSLGIGACFLLISLALSIMTSSHSDRLLSVREMAGLKGTTLTGIYDNSGGLLPCPNPIESKIGDDYFYTCTQSYQGNIYQSLNNNNALDDKASRVKEIELPSPVYKRTICGSNNFGTTFGCSQKYHYVSQVPYDLLTKAQKEQVMDTVMSLPDIKEGDLDWKLDHFFIDTYWGGRWKADVQFFVDGIKQLPPSQDCGWYGSVEIDLETLEILSVSNIPPRSNVNC